MNGIFAIVEPSWAMNGVRIHLGNDTPAGRVLRNRNGGSLIAIEFTEPEGYEPILSMSNEEARELLRALAAHFGGAVEDTRSLRRDYDAERGRVDKLIDHLIEVDAIGARGDA